MGKLKHLWGWLFSDWRLLVVVPLIVTAVFVFSAGGFDAMKEAHEAYLRWQFARDNERELRKTEEIFLERDRQRAQLAGRFMPSDPGL